MKDEDMDYGNNRINNPFSLRRLFLCMLGFVPLIFYGCKTDKTSPSTIQLEQLNLPVSNIEGRQSPLYACYRTEGWSYSSMMDKTSSKGPNVILAAWADGYVIYSDDQNRGGPPYYGGSIDPSRIESFIRDLLNQGLWTDSRYITHYPYDAGFLTVVLKHSDNIIHLSSAHERYEASGKAVDTARSIEALQGRSKKDVLSQQPKSYLHFRKMWDLLRSRSKSLIPEKANPISVEFKLDYIPSTFTPLNFEE